MNDASRIWIYCADRELIEEEIKQIQAEGADFAARWTVHNNQLRASFTVHERRFLVLAVDESLNGASGCSIDSSVNFVKTLEEKIGTRMLNGGKVGIELNGEIQLLSMPEIREMAQKGEIKAETLMYDHLVPTLGDMRNNFRKPANSSWLRRFIPANETA